MTSSDPVSLGELARRFDRLDNKMNKHIVYRDTYIADQKTTDRILDAHGESIKELKENNRWLIRTLITTLIAVLLQMAGLAVVWIRTLS